MAKGYHHLTYEQRCQLHVLKTSGFSVLNIAKELGVHRSSVHRELARNSGQKGYRYKQAHEKATDKRRASTKGNLKMTPDLVRLINEKLALLWSPEQIAGWLKKIGLGISYETIYQYIWKDKRQGGSLYKYLRHYGKKYNKRSSGKAGRGCIPERIDISERPIIVEEKSRVGDWEVDSIIGRGHKGAIVSMVDRCSKYTILVKVERKTSEEVRDALVKRLSQEQGCVLTVTSDNGKEFSCHREISKALGADFYFARPYHSWERGLNEHTNGLVRQYVPKSTYFENVSEEEVSKIEHALNNRPRKVLKFQTPQEVFNLHKKKTGCAQH